MKLATDLPLRKDQTVTATVPGGSGQPAATYTFKPDASGQTTADIDCEEHVGYLLDTGNFYPADEKDIGAGVAALALQAGAAQPAAQAAATGDPAPAADAENAAAAGKAKKAGATKKAAAK